MPMNDGAQAVRLSLWPVCERRYSVTYSRAANNRVTLACHRGVAICCDNFVDTSIGFDSLERPATKE